MKEAVKPDLEKKYDSKYADVGVYKIGDAKTIEVEAYDTLIRELHEDKAITVENK